ncbi:aminopeptidase N [Corynebacterium liangguodongii]|uniref:Aminopeptidase N n=1 Tax=Corynebacterium liangguodongii TaxID=2079535 RepID=A0A2S0WFL0_9CORY|nr:aminopeptidase N [Corynebacterium liangguodongii]AWB84546.1 aminopeptidase N [Corynebacterium liangguodongii]PWB98870.1 aminopeptidase N [Corynebacterium liangguodongii]
MKTNLSRIDAQSRAALISDVHYDIALDITGESTFTSITTARFTSKEGKTFFDLVADSFSATLDGTDIAGRDLDLAAGEHVLQVTATSAYNRTGEGLHKFTDPADDKDYLYTQFEPAYAMKVFACFDQPDLKATYSISVTAPQNYVVVLNEATTREGNTWSCTIDYPLSTYLIAVCAGEYESVHDTYSDEHKTIELGLYARASLVSHMDSERLFRQTKEGFAYYHENFGRPYPFGKYDQIFCPEYNMGAMENVGAVTFRDEYIFTSEPTPYKIERRNDTILHEMAHMWFGDLVTMQWWDDLWLNESFATWSAAIAQSEIGVYENAWVTFAAVEKAWAYSQDQLPSTHPIAADAPDIETAEQNFDGITYAKGASVLKQLQAYVGRDAFFAGVRAHFANHAYSNATFADLLAALEESSGFDLQDWAEKWLRTTGVSRLYPVITPDSFTIVQDSAVMRPHRVGVGLYSLIDGHLTRTHHTEVFIDGERTEVAEFAGIDHDLALVNDDDLTYCLMGLTEPHMRVVLDHLGQITDPMARALCWSAAWEATRDGRLPAREYVRLVARFAAAEDQPAVQERLLNQAITAAKLYVDPAWRDQAFALLNDAFRGAAPATIFDRALARVPLDEASSRHFAQLLETSTNREVRWLALTALIAFGERGVEAAAAEDDTSSEGAVSRLRARAVADKRWAWNEITTVEHTNLELRYLIDGLTFNGNGLEGAAEEYFRIAPQLWDRLSNEMAQRTLEGIYPMWEITEDALKAADDLLAREDIPAGLRRVLSEGRDRAARALRNQRVDAAS